MLDLANDITFDCLLSLIEACHDFLVGPLHHLTQHFNVLLSLLYHFFHVDFDLVFYKISPLHGLRLVHLKVALNPAQSQIL